MTTIYLKHTRAVLGPNGRGYCNRGLRAFCERHALDWAHFLENGIDVELVRHIDDEMVRAVIAEAEKDGR